jgi:outer membrane lipoprotein-sorting protein
MIQSFQQKLHRLHQQTQRSLTAMPFCQRALIALSALILAGSSTDMASPALAKTSNSDQTLISNASPVVRGNSTNMTDGVQFINKCLQASESYKDYSFDYTQIVNKGSGSVTEKGTLWVKKPNLLKVVVHSGPHGGSVAVLQANGKVKAHGGGAMKFLSVELSPESGYLKSANGWPMVKSDFSSIWKAMQGYAKEGCPCKATESPVKEPTQPKDVLVLEMTKDGQMYKRALIDPSTDLPVEWWDYQEGKVYAHSVWTDFKGNQGLSDEVFTIKGK